jgi:hypothetical protein
MPLLTIPGPPNWFSVARAGAVLKRARERWPIFTARAAQVTAARLAHTVLQLDAQVRRLTDALAARENAGPLSPPTPLPWAIGAKRARYVIPDPMAGVLRSKGLPAEFEALSIGRDDIGQVAIIPLDESNRENAEYIVNACNALPALIDLLDRCDRAFRSVADQKLNDDLHAVLLKHGRTR